MSYPSTAHDEMAFLEEEECMSLLVDGAWTYCGCEDCDDRERQDRERALSG